MAHPQLLTTSLPPDPGAKPGDEEIDLFGLTHPGKIRSENQDHFLLVTVHRQMQVHGASLPHPDRLPLRGERQATIFMVADGVGGAEAGGEASQLALEAVTRYVSSAMTSFHNAGDDPDGFTASLQEAVMEAHHAVLKEAEVRTVDGRMATTLTLAIAVWPRMYVIQVGDSRAYHYQDGALHRVTRDQTVAQDLVDQGVLDADRIQASPFSSVLSSAIGGGEAVPVVSSMDVNRSCCVLLCSDGLTRHVTDDEIAEQFSADNSSEAVCHALLDLALERGGADNITILVGRAQRSSR